MPCSPVHDYIPVETAAYQKDRWQQIPAVCLYIHETRWHYSPKDKFSFQQHRCSKVLKQWQIFKKNKKTKNKKKNKTNCYLRNSTKTADQCCLAAFPITAVKQCAKTHLCKSVYYYFKINSGNFSHSVTCRSTFKSRILIFLHMNQITESSQRTYLDIWPPRYTSLSTTQSHPPDALFLFFFIIH